MVFGWTCEDHGMQKKKKKKKPMEQIVLPIFYNVDLSKMRKQVGIYAQAFDEYEKRFKDNIDRVHTWRATLIEVANLSRFPLQDR